MHWAAMRAAPAIRVQGLFSVWGVWGLEILEIRKSPQVKDTLAFAAKSYLPDSPQEHRTGDVWKIREWIRSWKTSLVLTLDP